MKECVASKPRSKRNSDDDEERSEKKRNRIKSRKKRRRRRYSSLSSSSSDSDDDPRARRKRAKKPEKRKKESKIPVEKKKKRKKASRKTRHGSISSSSSYSSRSCSTFRVRSSSPGRSVSRGPTPKCRPRGRSGGDGGVERGRSGGDGGVERGRSRQRRIANYEVRDGRHRSRSCSTCERSGSRSPGNRDADRDEDKYEKFGDARRIRSALAVAGKREEVKVVIEGRSEQRDIIIHAYDDFNRYDARRDSDSYGGALERNSPQGAIQSAGSTWTEDKEVRFNQIEEQALGIDDVGDADFSRKNVDGSESLDMETQLRQKALDNFKKFRRSLSANTRSGGDQESDSSQTLNHKDSVGATDKQYALKPLDDKLASSCEQQENLDEEIWPAKPRLKSVVNKPAEKDNTSESHRKVEKSDSDNTTGVLRNPHLLKKRGEPSDNMSLQHASVKEKQAATDTGGSIADDANENQADVQPYSELSAHHELDSGNENKQEVTGLQFQKKTFSRMHDGELVQVSYKVYIPKRRPVVERRQLHG